ncbi:MAG: tetratricopeptide repeat protein [Rhodoferax sp.]|nr:tetratricopeptide repeat protein [Rhodoferax sp.]
MKTTRSFAGMLGLALALLSAQVAAQTIESLEWVDGAEASVARIHFAANVRFLRQAPGQATLTDLAQLGFQIVSADESVLTQSVEEGKRLGGQAGQPRIELNYVPVAKAQTKLLTLRFGEKLLLQVRQGPGARSIDLVLTKPSADNPADAPLPAAAEVPGERHFVVVLQSLPAAQAGQMPRIPAAFQNYEVFTQNQQRAGAPEVDLVLGYFKTAQDAEAVRQRALGSFPAARLQRLPDAPALATAPPAAPAVPATATVQTTVGDVDGQGEQLLQKARQAFDARRFQEAVDACNQALMLPPNPFTPAAQELIGLAWEALGQRDKARSEYQLYLRLYPEGEAAARVEQRLAALGAAPALAKAGAKDTKDGKNRLSATGSVSQYYYGGQTKTDSLVNIATGVDQNTLTKTNQSVLVSSWDATGRYETEDSISKLVMRGSHSDNLASASSLSSSTQGLISAAYVDYRDLKSRMDFRVGRQSAIGGSLFGLFDGVSMAMPVAENYKFDAMLGVPANTLVNAPQQTMAGVMLEADNLFEHWGGNLSLVEQTIEGISDRRAIGAEVRYFGEALSMYTQLDYDINFNVLNALTLQGSFQGPMDTTVTMLVDDRKAPSLQLSDALISSGKSSLSTLLQTMSLDQAQSLALATAAQARQAMVSVSRALSANWQGSMDLRYSEVGALPAVGNFQAQPATGAQISTSFQLTGSNLYSSRDINGFNLSLISSDSMSGTQLAFNNLTGFMDNKMSLEPSIRFYTQTDNTQTKISRISPGLRVSYKLSNHANLMAEGIYESAQTDGPSNHETSESIFFYIGYRYDFQ